MYKDPFEPETREVKPSRVQVNQGPGLGCLMGVCLSAPFWFTAGMIVHYFLLR